MTGAQVSRMVLRTAPQKRPAMVKVDHTSDAGVPVGIDISRHRHEVWIAVPGKTRRRRMTITDTTDDSMRRIAVLRGYGMPVRIGFKGQTMGLAAIAIAC